MKYIKIFVVVMFLNQLLFFGLCLRPDCLVAATPHVLIITIAIGLSWNSISGSDKGVSASPEGRRLIEGILTEPQQHQLVEVHDGNLTVLKGAAHYKYLMRSLNQANAKLVIMSGWLSKHVMDNVFLRTLEDKLRSGVEIYIGYGFQDGRGKHTEFSGTKKVLKSLGKLMDRYPNSFFVASFATHEKLLIIDDKVVVIGSANWLSNRRYRNSERSVVIQDDKFALSEAERAQTVIMQNHISF